MTIPAATVRQRGANFDCRIEYTTGVSELLVALNFFTIVKSALWPLFSLSVSASL